MRLRTGVLRTRMYRVKFQQVDATCMVCCGGIEMPDHVITDCGGLGHPRKSCEHADFLRALGFNENSAANHFQVERGKKRTGGVAAKIETDRLIGLNRLSQNSV